MQNAEQYVLKKLDELKNSAITKQHWANPLAFPVLFNLQGTHVAGKATMTVSKQTQQIVLKKMSFNPKYLAEMTQAQIDNLIVHELAHFLCHLKYGNTVNAHGREWQAIMWSYGQNPKDYLPCIKEGYVYSCNCKKEIFLSTRRHNMIQLRKASYSCTKCNAILVYQNKKL